MERELRVVGKRMPHVNGVEKATGVAKFVSDISLPGMLIGRILHSPMAHARIVSMDTSKAEALEGVGAVVTLEDVPKRPYSGEMMHLQLETGIDIFGANDMRVLDEKVRYVGQAVAAVAAINEKVAEAALESIHVEYEPLPSCFDELEAMKEGAPKIHDVVQGRQADGTLGRCTVEHNIGVHISPDPVGDVEKGFREADHIIEETVYTSKQRQAPIESFHCVASFDARGKLTLWTPSQLPHLIKKGIANIFDIPLGDIRVKCEYAGGAFGAGWVLFKEPLCIALARKSGKPVKLIYTRQEEFTDRPTRSYFGPFTMKMGVKNDGSITALERKIVSGAGGYIESAGLEALVGASTARPLYRCPNYKAEIDVVYTNKVPCGAMRGFGTIEDAFIREQVIDEAAERVGLDPVEFRLKNLCEIGDPGTFGPDYPLTSIALAECIRRGAERIGWPEKWGGKKGGKRRKGVGVSCMAHCSGAWPAHINTSSASIRLNEDATAVLTVSPAPLGQGALGTLAQVAAEVLGMPYEDVHVIWGDTDVTMYETGSFATRSLYIIGNAVMRAATEVREKLLHRAAGKLGVASEELDIIDRRIYVKNDPEKGISAAEITWKAIYDLYEVEQITGVCTFTPDTNPPPYQALFSEVEVDTETGEVKVFKMVIAMDSGVIVNPMVVEGQLQGGAGQGFGYALLENPVMDAETGRVLTDDFDTYKIACTLDMPELEVLLVEQPEPTGPFGAKGVGEPGCVNQAASIANAIYDAAGIRIWELPMTPEKVLKAFQSING
jgi:xanthine dehydrogenase molybdenum-binding subunit